MSKDEIYKEIKSFQDLIVWKKSLVLTNNIYEVTRAFPKDETFGLVSQMRRASISICSNIAEGKSRQHLGEYIQFLYISHGSLAELHAQLLICEQLKFVSNIKTIELETQILEVGRMLHGLIKKLKP